MRKLYERIKTSRFLGAVFTLASGTALGQAIGLISTPIVSRLYDTTAYGEYAILVSYASIICTVSQAGLASAIMLPREDEKACRVFSAAAYIQLVVVLLVCAIAAAISPWFRLFTMRIHYLAAIGLLCIHMLLTNIVNLLRIYMTRRGLYRALFWNSLISAFGTLAVTVPIGFVSPTFMGFWIASVLAGIVSIAQMLAKANPFCRLPLHGVVDIVKEYKDFSIYQLPANLLSSLAQQMPKQMMDRYSGSSSVGSFAMSEKIFGIPLKLIATPVGEVYFKTASEHHRLGKEQALGRITYSLVKKVLIIGAVPLAVLIGFGEEIFAFVLGAQWAEAGRMAAVLGLSYVFTICSTITSYCRVSLEKQKANFVFAIVQVAVIAASLMIGRLAFGTAFGMIACFAAANTILLLVDNALNFFLIGAYTKKFVAFAGIYTLLFGCACYFVSNLRI